MNAKHDQRRQSWRQPGATRATAQASSLRGKRVFSTLALLALLVAAGWFISSTLNRRYQHTLVGTLFTASRTNTSEPEQPYTLVPLRFGSETLAPLKVENTTEFRVESLNASFDNAENLSQSLLDLIAQLERKDALVLWVRAKGAAINDTAYLLGGDYRLPVSGAELDAPRGAVPLKSILAALSTWSGPSLVLLDWGNQLTDARAGVWDNQFLQLAVADIAAASPQVYCLASHLPGELSLESLAGRQSLFGRACAEAIVGPRRVPESYQPIVRSDGELLIGDLAEYVIRRVQADSDGLQTPWLIQGGTGWVSAERNSWTDSTSVAVVRMTDELRPWGWPNWNPDASPTAKTDEPKPSNPTSEGQTRAPIELTDEVWPTGPLWVELEKWTRNLDSFGEWTPATLAPLTARRLSAQLEELEARWLAGEDFRSGSSANDLAARIDELRARIAAESDRVAESARAGPLSELHSPPPTDVDRGQFDTWRQWIEAHAAFRRMAICLPAAAQLGDNLAAISNLEIANNLKMQFQQGISAARDFLNATQNSQEPLSATDPALLIRRLRDARSSLDEAVADLVQQVLRDPGRQQPIAELLLRYNWLSYAQRREVLRAYLIGTAAQSGGNAGTARTGVWPTKDLSLLQPKPPQQKRGTTSLWSDLARLSAPSDANLAEANAPEGLVSLITAAAQSLQSANAVSESQWIAVDDRDLCQKEGGWPPQLQQPQLPQRPEPVSQWRVTWANPQGATLADNRLQFESSTQPASLDLRLTRVGAAEEIESIQFRFSGLVMRVGGEQTNWQQEKLEVPSEMLLSLASVELGLQSLPIELRALGMESNTKPTLEVTVKAGNHSPPQQRLVCGLPLQTPVQLTVQQLICRDGQTAWSDCDRLDELITLRPFAGRKTQFRMALSNIDERPRTAVVELYRVPARSRETAAGRIADIDGQIPLVLERQSLSTLERFAASPPIELGPSETNKLVDFSGASSVTDVGDAGAAGAAGGSVGQPATPANGGAATDISWGVLAVVRLKAEPNRKWPSWLQINPIRAGEYLAVASRVLDGSQVIQFTVSLRDDNGDGIPDLLPADLTQEQPIAIQYEVGSGIDMAQATLPPPNRMLTRDKTDETFVLSAGTRIVDEVELRVHVDGSPRAIMHFVGVDGRVGRREPPDRLWLRSIGVEEGLSYVSEFKPNYLPSQRRFGRDVSAIFATPLAKRVNLILAVDSETRNQIDAPSAPVTFWLQGDNWQHPFGSFFGDRDLSAKISEPISDSLSVDCRVDDWKFDYPADAAGDFEAKLLGSMRGGPEQNLGQLILDGRPPVLVGSPSVKGGHAGQNMEFAFSVEDRSPLGEAKILVGPPGQPQKAQPVGETLSQQDFLQQQQVWQLKPWSLPVAELPPGRYEIRVEISDIVGNKALLGPWPLLIGDPPNTAGDTKIATPLRGTVRGQLFFRAPPNKPPNEVRVRLLELNNKTTTSSSGSFMLADVEAGEYTLEATTTWQGASYKAEKKIVLKKKEDWQQEFVLALTKQ